MGFWEETREMSMTLICGIKAACCQHGLGSADADGDPRLGTVAFQLCPGAPVLPLHVLSFGW